MLNIVATDVGSWRIMPDTLKKEDKTDVRDIKKPKKEVNNRGSIRKE
ncbi:MAG: hypothetical protein ACM3SR_07635 [Ignavibacteriales bacterium]